MSPIERGTSAQAEVVERCENCHLPLSSESKRPMNGCLVEITDGQTGVTMDVRISKGVEYCSVCGQILRVRKAG